MSKLSTIKDLAEKALDAEFERMEFQISKAEKYIAGMTLIVGFQLFETKDLVKNYWGFRILVGSSIILLALSLIFALLAIRVRDYGRLPRNGQLKELLEDKDADELDADQEITDMLLEVREGNAKLNDKNAVWLQLSGWFLLVGFLSVVLTQIMAAFH